jgi:fido (protein-threonine AMPylation protein)
LKKKYSRHIRIKKINRILMKTEQAFPNQAMWDTLTHMLALNRSAEYLQALDKVSEKTNQLDPMKQKRELESMFYDIHRILYQDTHSGEQFAAQRAGNIVDSEKRIQLRNALHAMADELFDANARAVYQSHDALAEALAKHYVEIRQIEPFGYGNELTLSTFFTAVSRLPLVREIEGTSIDFRRLDEADLEAFKTGKPQELEVEAIKVAFLHALDTSRDTSIPNQRAKANMLTVTGDNKPQLNKLANGEKSENKRILKGWPDRALEIAGVPFLGYEEDKKLYLVTITGDLVDYDSAKNQVEAALKNNKLIDELPKFKSTKRLPNTTLPTAASGYVDGFAYDEQGAPLVCLDVNLLTGLRSVAHEEFLSQFKKYHNGADIFRLKDPEQQKDFLAHIAQENDERLTNICKTACEHIQQITLQIDAEAEKEVAGKPTADKPLMVLSMGGSGSGKGMVKDYIAKLTNSTKENKNYVDASLDDYRSRSGLYKLMQAAGHHADDYSLVEPFANTMRKWVAHKAMEQNLNILYDGSAIPYKGRYDDLVNTALANNIQTKDGIQPKKAYEVDVVAVDAYMDVPDAAKALNLGRAVTQRVVDRFNGAEARCLPWGVTLNKHTDAMRSFLDAAEDSRLHHVMLFNTDCKPENAYLAAYATTVSENDKIATRQSLETLDVGAYKSILVKHGFTGEQLAKIPFFQPENIGFTLRTNKGNERALIITDMHKMVQMAEKGLQNPFASDMDALHYRTSKLAGVVPSPSLTFVDRVIADANQVLSRVLNYVVPSDNYQQALQKQNGTGNSAIVP